MENVDVNIEFENVDFWYTKQLRSVQWPEVFRETAPYISPEERNTLLHVASSNGINPVMLLTSVIYTNNLNNNNASKVSFKSDLEYVSGILKESFFNISETNDANEKENEATRSVWIFVQRDLIKMSQFISIYQKIKAEVEKYVYRINADDIKTIAPENRKQPKGENSALPELIFPYPTNECWQMGPTHHSNKFCYGDKCRKTSIDFAPSLFMNFGQTFEYFNSDGTVVASHAGEVVVDNDCSMSIYGDNVQTYYSHIKVKSNNGDRVEQGEEIGQIALSRERANCNCEISKDETECAVGPHLHFEVRSENGEPVDINGYIFSGFRVKTGLKSYDKGCGPEHCRSGMSASEVEASCSTIFIRLSDDETFCATHQGAGLGISNSQFFFIFSNENTNFIRFLIKYIILT